MTKEERKEYDKQYRILNKDKIALSKKIYRENNKEKENNRLKKYREENRDKVKVSNEKYKKNNINKIKIIKQNYVKNNPEKIRESNKQYVNKRKLNDPLFRIKCKLKIIISNSLNRTKYIKNNKSIDILGCSYDNFKLHLELLWEPWLNWDNYGKYNGTEGFGWDVDHIIPLSSATTEEGLLKLNHFSNLQPLCSYTNRNIKKDMFSIIT